MVTIKELQEKLRAFDSYARNHPQATSLQTQWSNLFATEGTTLNRNAANAFAAYYRDMRSKSRRTTRKMRGGSSPAPLTYQMVPGANVAVYGRFPVEADTDPSTIRDLDVFWQSGLTGTCGGSTAGWPTVPAGMGSNQVGAGRKRKSRKGRRSLRKSRSRKMRGGNFLDSLVYRPIISTAPQNIAQIGYHNAMGGVPSMPIPSSPVHHTWNYVSNGTAGLINPGAVTYIDSDMSKLASPVPWQTA